MAGDWCVFIFLRRNVDGSHLPPFSLIRDFGKQNTGGNVSKISVSLTCYRHIGSKSTNHSPLEWRREGQKITLVAVIGGFRSDLSITLNTDGNFGKDGFRGCFIFQSRVSTKTAVIRFQSESETSFFKFLQCKALDKRDIFGDQTPSNIVWWPNILMLKRVAKRLKHVWSNTDQTIDTSHWASVVCMPASNMFDTRLSKRTKHENKRNNLTFWSNVWCPSNFIEHD